MSIIKIVLCIAILSSFEEHKGIQCINPRVYVLKSFSSKNVEIFHRKCYLVLFTYIAKELHLYAPQNTYEGIQEKLESSADYYLRLLRLHDSIVDSKIINNINKNNWNFYLDYKRWILINRHKEMPQFKKDAYRQKLLDNANSWIDYGMKMNAWSYVNLEVENNILYVMRDFNYCKTTLNLISAQTNNIEESINSTISCSSKFDKLVERSEPLTKFGYIMHLMKIGEKNKFMEKTTDKKSYAIKIMKSVLNRIFDGVILILIDINFRPTSVDLFNDLLQNDDEASNQLTIMIQLYLKAIDTTKEIYGVNETTVPKVEKRRKISRDDSRPPSEFMTFITTFQAKFQSLCPGCFKVTTETNKKVFKKTSSDTGSPPIDENIGLPPIDKNTGSPPIDENSGLPPIFGILNTCWPNAWVPSREPEDVLDVDVDLDIDSLNLIYKPLLEYNVYLTILYEYAIYFNGGSPTENLKSLYESHKNFLENNKNKKNDQNKLKNPIIIFNDDD